MDSWLAAFNRFTSACFCDTAHPEGYAREGEFVLSSAAGIKSLPPEILMHVSPHLSAFQRLLKLPHDRLHKISKVDMTRSAEQWAEVAEAKAQSTWHGVTKLRFTENMPGEPVSYVKTGSILDGWKEYFLLTRYVLSPDPVPDRMDDILFARAH